MLLRSDGFAVACGCNDHGDCDIPELDDGATYKIGVIHVWAKKKPAFMLRHLTAQPVCQLAKFFQNCQQETFFIIVMFL